MHDDPEERALADAAKRGDENAWRVLFDRHAGAAYRYSYVRTGRRRERAEEAVQEAWMIAVRKLGAFDASRGTFGAWLQGILANVIANQNRRWARRDAAEFTLDSAHTLAGRATPGDDRLALALTELPAGYQDALRAKYIDGRTVNEIAHEWGRTPKAIESTLTRARTALRDAYNRYESQTRETKL
jgi:RNA polymerase sigma-70 factor (ECF subfamily)